MLVGEVRVQGAEDTSVVSGVERSDWITGPGFENSQDSGATVEFGAASKIGSISAMTGDPNVIGPAENR